jgi:hypothetical protein
VRSGEDPNSGNVHKDLRSPDEVYEKIGEFWEEKAEVAEE